MSWTAVIGDWVCVSKFIWHVGGVFSTCEFAKDTLGACCGQLTARLSNIVT
ncbi:hypothetical protein PSPO01_06003 [Paraphaeosphaeria sporulosa]